MKKFLAIMMSVIMAFTLVAFPASAAVAAEDEDTTATVQPEVSLEDVINSLVVTIELVQATLVEVHNIVGTIMGVLEKDCPLCGVLHEINFGTTGDGEAEDGAEGDAETDLPAIDDGMTEDEKEVAEILKEILILTGQLVSSVK